MGGGDLGGARLARALHLGRPALMKWAPDGPHTQLAARWLWSKTRIIIEHKVARIN